MGEVMPALDILETTNSYGQHALALLRVGRQSDLLHTTLPHHMTLLFTYYLRTTNYELRPTTLLLFYYTTVLLYYCTAVLVNYFIALLLYYFTTVLLS